MRRDNEGPEWSQPVLEWTMDQFASMICGTGSNAGYGVTDGLFSIASSIYNLEAPIKDLAGTLEYLAERFPRPTAESPD
jgi:hypothetical protein